MWKYLIPYILSELITSVELVAPVLAIIARFQVANSLMRPLVARLLPRQDLGVVPQESSLVEVVVLVQEPFGQGSYQVEALVLQGLAGLATYPLVLLVPVVGSGKQKHS
jgi:hypothetical protein